MIDMSIVRAALRYKEAWGLKCLPMNYFRDEEYKFTPEILKVVSDENCYLEWIGGCWYIVSARPPN